MNEELKIQSNIDNLIKVENLIDNLSKRLGVSDEVYGKVLVSTIEAVNNAIIHGNKNVESKAVYLVCSSNGSSLTIIVKDEGEGYNFNNIPDPTSVENLEKLSGRGVFIMKKLADDIEFNEFGNEVKMTFKY
ncbi:MAG TPA: ATP-binding protein [Bacteroidales bacterium]|nr:ATP-binding protein [Bacteroidales bacterium]